MQEIQTALKLLVQGPGKPRPQTQIGNLSAAKRKKKSHPIPQHRMLALQNSFKPPSNDGKPLDQSSNPLPFHTEEAHIPEVTWKLRTLRMMELSTTNARLLPRDWTQLWRRTPAAPPRLRWLSICRFSITLTISPPPQKTTMFRDVLNAQNC